MNRVLLMTITEDNEEMLSLLSTLGVKEVHTITQRRAHPHKVGFLGPGKLDEVDRKIKEGNYDVIVVNGDLRPSQHHYLEMRFQKECIDRTGVILRIFADHAHTPEAIAQVTLARLRYEQPFLREWIHKAKSGDRPGFLAGGAYATDVYYEHARTHARKIEKRLEELSKQREILRRKRHERGYSLVSLAGYTNAGKSALFNRLSGAQVEVNDRFFSTLSTTTRRLKGFRGNVLIADTVGFIKDLPPDLVDAFNSTLEEIFYADLILLVFDASESQDRIESKLRTSLDVLLPKIRDQILVVIGNKSDLLTERQVSLVRDWAGKIVSPNKLIFVSAKTGAGLDELLETIATVQKHTYLIEAEMPLSSESYSLSSRLRAFCSVTEDSATGKLVLTIKCNPADAERITAMIRRAKGSILKSEEMRTPEDSADAGADSMGSEGAPL